MPKAVSLVMCYNAAGELLLGKRKDTGEYTLPGGHANDDESPEDCARRELMEEAGIEAQSLSPLTTVETPHATLSFFTAYCGNEPVVHSENDPDQEVESDDWQWVSVKDGLPKRFYDHLAGPDDDKNIVRQIFDMEKSEEPLVKAPPFNPADVPANEKHLIRRWQGAPGRKADRDKLPRMEGAARLRALSWISKNTQHRMNPTTNQREYLLHRGIGPKERKAIGSGNSVTHEKSSSWTPFAHVAERFGSKDRHRGGTLSAWVSENAIHTVPHQFGDVWGGGERQGPNAFANEGEVVVAPHTSTLATPPSSPRVAKSEDEVSTLLQHPNPAERLMALRLDSVNPVHLQTASLDPDPTVHEAAIEHPSFGSAQGMHLLEATADASGKPPTAQQLAFLSHVDRVQPGHLDTAQRLSQGRLDDTLAKHPGMNPDLIRQMFQDPHVSLRHRMDLLRHPQAPADLLGEVVKAQMLVPSVDSSKLAETALAHPKMSHDILAQLIHAGADPMVQPHLHVLAMHALQNSSVPHDLIDELFDQGAYRATGGHAALRYSAASGPSATPEHIESALNDRDPLVWKNLGQAKNLQPRHVGVILQRLMAENPRDQAAMQALSGSKAFNMGHLNQMLGQPIMKSELSKAIKPEHLSSIAKAVDKNAYKVVDHTPDLTAHPAVNGAHVEAYRQQVLNSPNEIKKKTGGAASRSAGITRKVVFQAQVPGEEGVSKFMVKPYHERVIRRVSGWQKHPHQGWAEMTNQALYHAAGIGHLHQNVSVSEHDMGPGHEKEPALVIHIKPGMKNQADAGTLPGDPFSQESGPHQDARKIAVMDMLSNNLDRHYGNLLQGQDSSGKPTLLAVDHSRSFQYIAPHDGLRSPKKHGELEDTFGSYHQDSAVDGASPAIPEIPHSDWKKQSNRINLAYAAQMKTLESYQPVINDWWSEVGPKVRQEFHSRLDQIKDPQIRAHLKRNFDARADWLDERAEHGIENYGVTDWHKDPIPMFRPGELTDKEKEEKEEKERSK